MIGEKQSIYVLCNSKTKLYPDGSSIQCVCSRDIFKRDGFEKQEKFKVYEDILSYEQMERAIMQGPAPPITEEIVKRHMKKRKKDITEVLTELTESDPRDDSLKRAHDRIFDIIMLNDWDYFITGTFNDKIVDGTDSKAIIKPLQDWLKNTVRRKGLRYILIPELHKSGRVHFHGLINDCLRLSDSGRSMYMGHCFKRTALERMGVDYSNLKTVYNIDDWRFGWSTAIETDEHKIRMARYVTKYVTKDIQKIFGKYFWTSKNIAREPPVRYDVVNYSDIYAVEFMPLRCTLRFKYVSDFKE